jgi:hypothetical protein
LLLGWAVSAGATDSPAVEVQSGHGCKIFRSYVMVPQGDYALPGPQKLLAERKGDAAPILFFMSPRDATVTISPSGKRVLVRDSPSTRIYRLILVDLDGAARLSEDVRVKMLKAMPATGVFDLGWICGIDSPAYEHFLNTRPSPQLLLEPKFLGFSPDEKKCLLTFKVSMVLGDASNTRSYEKSFKRRYYVVDRHGRVLKELRGAHEPQAWWR